MRDSVAAPAPPPAVQPPPVTPRAPVQSPRVDSAQPASTPPESLTVQCARLLERVSPERLLRDLLAETMRQGGRGFSGAVDLALATLACHASLRSGDAVSPAEARALLAALDGADFSGHCPHGRPIVSFTPWSELLRKVGRR